MHLNEIKKKEQANLGFQAELAYAGSRGCVRMHELAYATLPRNIAHKHQLNLL